jgi:hypothetical protein
MRLLLRKIFIFVIAVGLGLSGAASHANAKMSSTGTDKVSLHESQDVQRYADLAIEPGEQDCAHATADTPTQHSHDDGLCKKCCAACTSTSASLIPSAPFPVLALSEARTTFSVNRNTLVAYTVPTDPGIPRPLS